jgi:hypothetical protein
MQVSEWGIRIARDPPMQQSSHAGDDVIEASGSQTVIPAQGAAGVSDRMRSARETVMAYSPLRALQGGIQWRYLTDWDYPSPHLCET